MKVCQMLVVVLLLYVAAKVPSTDAGLLINREILNTTYDRSVDVLGRRDVYCQNCGELVQNFNPYTDLLNGVNQVTLTEFGGDLLLFGDGSPTVPGISVPLFKDSLSRIPVAAAKLGQGRLVVAANSQYGEGFGYNTQATSFQKLHDNIKSWLGQGASISEDDICTINSIESAEECLSKDSKIICINKVRYETTDGMNGDIIDFVQNGGGVFIATTPTEEYIMGGKDMNKLAFIPLLVKSGISFTLGFSDKSVTTSSDYNTLRKLNYGYLIASSNTEQTATENGDELLYAFDALYSEQLPVSVREKLSLLFQIMLSQHAANLKYPDETTPFVHSTPYNKFLMKLYLKMGLKGSKDFGATPWSKVLSKDGVPCTFPFMYDGQMYSECTKVDASTGRLWCSVTDNYDKDKKWKYCLSSREKRAIHIRQYEDCIVDELGYDYYGQISQTRSGRTCQRWDSQSPWTHSKASKFPDGTGTMAENYCRNIGGDSGGPWCYTTDTGKRWEYCDIPICTSKPTGVATTGGNGDGAKCAFPFTYNGQEYNKCTSFGRGKPWCAVTDNYQENPKWGFCIGMHWPDCTSTDNPKGTGYSGNVATTRSGRTCQRWDSQSPHTHKKTFPGGFTTHENFCRNPDDSKGPWCYTTDPDKRWEYCDIPPCVNQNQIGTYEGNSNGAACTFPFIYKQKEYHECTDAGSDTLWCSTTDNFEHDGKWGKCILTVTKLPGISYWPGDVSPTEPRFDKDLTFTTERYDFISTGLYHPAGSELRVTVLSNDDDYYKWQVRIGCHDDWLYKKDKLYRWPLIATQRHITSKEFVIPNDPHGGLIYLHSPSSPSNITIKIHQVVQAPYFRHQVDDEDAWNRMKQLNAPHGDFAGKYITFSMPTKSIANVDYNTVKQAMIGWDKVVENSYDLRGDDIDKARRQFVTTDVQISVGWLHSGHPIMAHTDKADPNKDVFFLNPKWDSAWGMYHEMGHNMQRGWWTTHNKVEVTVNIFSLYNMEKMASKNAWEYNGDSRVKAANAIIQSSVGAERFTVWKAFDAWDSLVVYAQLQHYFGWDCYKMVFRDYESSSGSDRPGTDQEEYDQWVSRWSKAVNYNLMPLFDFWGWDITQSVKDSLSGLTPFMPPETDICFTEQAVKDDASAIAAQYPGCVRELNPAPVCTYPDVVS